MKKILYICTTLFLFGIVFYSCVKDDLKPNQQNVNSEVYLTVDEAKKFFEDSYSAMATKSGLKGDATYILSTGDFTPQWQRAALSENRLIGSVDVPISADYKYKVVRSEFKNGKSTPYSVDVTQKLVVVKGKEKSIKTNYILSLIPDKDYYSHNKGDISNKFIHSGNKSSYSGYAIYTHPVKHFIIAMSRYKDGKMVANNHLNWHKLSSEELHTAVDRFLSQMKFMRYSSVASRGYDGEYQIDIEEIEVVACRECGRMMDECMCCKVCDHYPCKCCPTCNSYPCICCLRCLQHPCICIEPCELCGYNPCVCDLICPVCHELECTCEPCVYCGEMYCLGACQTCHWQCGTPYCRGGCYDDSESDSKECTCGDCAECGSDATQNEIYEKKGVEAKDKMLNDIENGKSTVRAFAEGVLKGVDVGSSYMELMSNAAQLVKQSFGSRRNLVQFGRTIGKIGLAGNICTTAIILFDGEVTEDEKNSLYASLAGIGVYCVPIVGQYRLGAEIVIGTVGLVYSMFSYQNTIYIIELQNGTCCYIYFNSNNIC